MFTHLERNWLRKVPKAENKKTPAEKSRKRTAGSPKTGGAKKVAKRIGQVRGNEWMKDQSGMVYRKVPANHNLIAEKENRAFLKTAKLLESGVIFL